MDLLIKAQIDIANISGKTLSGYLILLINLVQDKMSTAEGAKRYPRLQQDVYHLDNMVLIPTSTLATLPRLESQRDVQKSALLMVNHHHCQFYR